MEASTQIRIDLSKIKTAVQKGLPLTMTTYSASREVTVYLGEVISAFLRELNQEHMIEFLLYSLNELIANAKKANTKRVYFKEKKLDINKEADYAKGMHSFKADTLADIDRYLQMQKEAGLFIKLTLQAQNDKIQIEVRNNVALTIFEYKRMHDKLARAQRYVSAEEAFQQLLDDTEGAGLGLVILVLMLKGIGLIEENFRILTENNETMIRIILPISEQNKNNINILSSELVSHIDSLPQFPQNITSINRLLADPEVELHDVTNLVSNDVALTADLLRMVNSASFGLSSPCRYVNDAVNLVGIRGIKNLLYSIGTIHNLENLPAETEELWAHSYRVAFFSNAIATAFCGGDTHLVEDSYVCGLLHDMGKVIFETAHQEMFVQSKAFCAKKSIPSKLLETLTEGVNHSDIGARIAEKWNFPDIIVSVIRFHHTPLDAPEQYRKLAMITYLANLISHYQKNKIEFYQFDPVVLEFFNIKDESGLQVLSNKLTVAFDKQGTSTKKN